jgi:hypothetical protein
MKYVGNAKICRIKFTCGNANAAVHGDSCFLIIYIVKNNMYLLKNPTSSNNNGIVRAAVLTLCGPVATLVAFGF